MGATRKSGGHQKGAQDHAESQHGDKTREQIAKAWNNPGSNVTAGGANVGVGDEANDSGPQERPSKARES